MKQLLLLFTFLHFSILAYSQIRPGQEWKDTDGNFINAHGSSVVYDKGTYYWFGECRDGFHSQGISLYTSTDLQRWKNCGLVLKMQGTARDDENDISDGRLFERPSVVYNPETRKWVMWIHWELNQHDYGRARVCVAEADRVEGPYRFYKVFNPNGHDSRDQSLFADTDGRAYHFGSVDMNTNTAVALLRPDYLEPTQTETKILCGKKCEASSVFKVGDTYFGLFSGCTGWAPNAGRYAWTREILGTWQYRGDNFCTDRGRATTYDSQAACVFKINGDDDRCVNVGDRWNSKNPGASLQVWLPISMRTGFPRVRWHEEWTPDIFDKMYRYRRAATIEEGREYTLLELGSDRLVSKVQTGGFMLDDDNDETNLRVTFRRQGDAWIITDARTGRVLSSLFGTLRLAQADNTTSQLWLLTPQHDGYYAIESKADHRRLSVSGAATERGTRLFLAAASDKIPQLFAPCTDTY